MIISEIVDQLIARPSFREDLILWLSFEAFEEVPEWRRWDTGDLGYSYPVRPDPVDEDDEVADYPTLLLEQDSGSCTWYWILYGEHSKRIAAMGGYRLAGVAVEAGLAAYRAHYPTSA